MFLNKNISNLLYTETISDEGKVAKEYESIFSFFGEMGIDRYRKINEYVSKSLINQGASYIVYGKDNTKNKSVLPFDLIPRLILAHEWERLEKGLIQRNTALNLFLKDVYGQQQILKDKILPVDLILGNPEFNKQMMNIKPSGDVYCHICGTDIIKCGPDEFYVLEDNLRNPSGVSYVLSNRNALKKVAGELFRKSNVRSVKNYIDELLKMLRSVAPQNQDNPTMAIHTPGPYNSAYFEHALLARSMGVMLVEGCDLFVDNNFVYVKTINGPQRLDVIYRRIDDSFLDPTVFDKNSLMGVPGIIGAYRAGNVTIINAPGCGIADDKGIYAYVPKIIKYYLKEDVILNNVKTYLCAKDEDWNYVKDNLHKLVIKPVNMSGGYGISIGNALTEDQLTDLRKQVAKDRKNYIAQPIMHLSAHTTYIEEQQNFEQRHIDLRTYTLLGKDGAFVLPGGLSRVALKKGNLVVNSSQGGGSKDTWVLKN
ncbi:MAG: circularly permuted type 2 ATP-grasp protein [Chitinophagales bacterium]